MEREPKRATTAPWAKFVTYGFRQLYTQFAWTYDAIAAGVSFGEWQAWGRCAIPFLRGRRILELAHGPGHLHVALLQQGFQVTSIDLSAQMSDLARRRVEAFRREHPADAKAYAHLARADARRLPFRRASFESVVSTFPTEFIFARETLDEVRRVLVPGGAFVIVPTAQIQGRGLAERLVTGLYRITGRHERSAASPYARFEDAGFQFQSHIVDTEHAHVSVWVGTLPEREC